MFENKDMQNKDMQIAMKRSKLRNLSKRIKLVDQQHFQSATYRACNRTQNLVFEIGQYFHRNQAPEGFSYIFLKLNINIYFKALNY